MTITYQYWSQFASASRNLYFKSERTYQFWLVFAHGMTPKTGVREYHWDYH